VITFTCSDLRDFGVSLLAKTSSRFPQALLAVRENGVPVAGASVPNFSAVLINETDQPILGIVQVWKWRILEVSGIGEAILTPLASTLGVETLFGSEPFDGGNRRIIFPGSGRVITPDGVRGDNWEAVSVPPPDTSRNGCGFSFGGGLPEELSRVASVELHLDTVFLGDGRVLGPDDGGTLSALVSGLPPCREEARRIKADLRAGISSAALIEKLQELWETAKYPPRDPNFYRDMLMRHLLGRAIYFLHQQNTERLLSWLKFFEEDCRRTFYPSKLKSLSGN
jgi:hypothetical protein